MEKQDFTRLGERMYTTVLHNGLPVYVFPKPDFQKKYAFFATNYGGMDMRFCLDGTWHDTPAGVAHYLEHKMFDTKEGNALQQLAQNGASPNAFTSNGITGYYFETTQKFEENLSILLSFVSIPYFTEESVAKEQGIIGQEIGMIEDNPDWRVFNNLMKGLYQYHPIRESVAGSKESIAQITAQTLYECHQAFYCPANMVLCVAGDVEPEQIVEIAERVLPKEAGVVAQKDYGLAEGNTVAQREYTEKMEVSAPMFQIGFKGDAPKHGEEGMRQELMGDLACEVLLGNSTPLYARLYEQGLINRNFSYGYYGVNGAAFLVAGGESKDPRAVQREIFSETERIVREGVEQSLWERIKKGVYGNKVRSLNSFENLCIGQAQSFFMGTNFLEFPQVYESIQKEDVEQLLQTWVQPERTTLSMIVPMEGSGA